MFNKLRNKLLIINLIIISIILLISFTIIYIVTYNNVMNEYKKEIDRIQPLSTNSFRGFKDHFDFELLDEYYTNKSNTFTLLLNDSMEIDKISSLLDFSEDNYNSILNLILKKEANSGDIVYEDQTWYYKITSLDNTNIEPDEFYNDYGYRISLIDITSEKDMLNTLLMSLILIFIFMLIAIYFISLYFANKSIKPLNKLWNKQKQFVADATHELKTPLTIINANTDLLLMNENEKIKSQKKWLEYIKMETNGMNKLINDLLNSAKAEEENILFNNINVSDLIEEIILSFETILYEKNIKFRSNVEKNIIILTNSEKLKQVIVILLDNAIKYIDDNGKIEISLKKIKRNIIFEISNTGKGISKEDLPHIFERFYKSDKARTNNNSNSFGLGLYIAKNIICKLNGSLSCESSENKKTKFIIKI